VRRAAVIIPRPFPVPVLPAVGYDRRTLGQIGTATVRFRSMDFVVLRQHALLAHPEWTPAAAVRSRRPGAVELTMVDDVVLASSDVRTDRAAQRRRRRRRFAPLHRRRCLVPAGTAAVSASDVAVRCWLNRINVDSYVLVEQPRRADVVRAVRTLVCVFRLRSVISLVYGEQTELVGAVRADITPQRLVGHRADLLCLRRPAI